MVRWKLTKQYLMHNHYHFEDQANRLLALQMRRLSLEEAYRNRGLNINKKNYTDVFSMFNISSIFKSNQFQA